MMMVMMMMMMIIGCTYPKVGFLTLQFKFFFQIIYTPNENADPVVISLQGVSLEDVHKLFSEDYIRKKKEKEVKLTVRKSNLGKCYIKARSCKKVSSRAQLFKASLA